MKLALQEHLVPGAFLPDKLAWLEAHGFAGIELWAFDIEERAPEIKKAFVHSSIRITSLVGGYDGHLFHPSEKQRNTAISGVQRLIRSAKEVGAGGVIIIPAFGISRSPGVLTPHPPASPDDIATFGSILDLLAQAADQADVTVYVEVINRYESHAFNQIAEVAQAMQISQSPRLQLLIDTFHMNIEERSYTEVIEQHAGRIGYVHLSDSNRRAPGQGHFAFQPFFQTLKKVGYTGYLTMECFIDSPDELLAAKQYIESSKT